MIDTVVLTMPNRQFTIMNHNAFSPSTKGLFKAPYYTMGGRSYFDCYQNPKKSEQGYKPRLTARKRMARGGFPIELKVEFSVPKLLYGNNFDELKDTDFDLVIKTLQQRLKEMHVQVFSQFLEQAPVTTIHYSKNIVLTNGLTPSIILEEMKKLNLNMKLDVNETNYRNEGHVYKYRTNTYEVVLYDKLKDLKQAKLSEKRAVENDSKMQMHLFDDYKPKHPFEVVRLEIRLNSRTTIKKALKTIVTNQNLSFEQLFNTDISKTFLNQQWEDIIKQHSVYDCEIKSQEELLRSILIANPKMKLNKALKMTSAISLINEVGVRKFRQMIGKYDAKSWYRLNDDIKATKFTKKHYSPLQGVTEALQAYEPVKLTDYGFSV